MSNAVKREPARRQSPRSIPGKAVVAASGPKARVPRRIAGLNPAKERDEGPVEAAERISHRGAAHVWRTHADSSNLRQIPTLRDVPDRLASAAPRVPPLLQRRIVELAREAKLGF